MKTFTKEELEEILINHQHWLKEDCDGWENMRADLSGANLSGANLSGANLYRAKLSGAKLYRASLYRANLSGADLSGADLYRADLYRADLSGAKLSGADLSGADLSGANLYRANLSGANLYRANLSGADLSGANNLPFIPMACPDVGEFIAWKKASGKIIKLLVPSDAKRLSATGRKCRCNKAKVLAIENMNGTPTDITEIKSDYDNTFVYKVGKTVSVADFCEDRWQECSAGIHFFINRQEAVEY